MQICIKIVAVNKSSDVGHGCSHQDFSNNDFLESFLVYMAPRTSKP